MAAASPADVAGVGAEEPATLPAEAPAPGAVGAGGDHPVSVDAAAADSTASGGAPDAAAASNGAAPVEAAPDAQATGEHSGGGDGGGTHGTEAAAPGPGAASLRAAPEAQASGDQSDGEDDGGAEGGSTINDVVLAIEFIASIWIKIAAWIILVSMVAGIVYNSVMRANSTDKRVGLMLVNAPMPKLDQNWLAGIVCGSVSGATLLLYLILGVVFRFQGMHWTRRRWRVYCTRVAELAVITVSFACWAYASNGDVLRTDCKQFNFRLVIMSCVRSSMSNALMCAWVMTARGMTIWRGGQRTLIKRMSMGAWQAAVRCWGRGEMPPRSKSGEGGSSKPDELREAASAALALQGKASANSVHAAPAALSPAATPAAAAAATVAEAEEPPPAASDAVAVEVLDTLDREAAAGRAGEPHAFAAAAAAEVAPPAGELAAGAPPDEPPPLPLPSAASLLVKAADLLPSLANEQVLYIDGPLWRYLLPVLWIWTPFQVVVLANAFMLSNFLGVRGTSQQGPGDRYICPEWAVSCSSTTISLYVAIVILLSFTVVYFLIYLVYCFKAFMTLRTLPYAHIRELNMYLSVEARIRITWLLFRVANDFATVFYAYPRELTPTRVFTRCSFNVEIVLQVWSTQAVFCVLVVIIALLYMPWGTSTWLPILQVTLQRFAWIERYLKRELARRQAAVPPRFLRAASLNREPMFCFETALKLSYWCEHAYYYEEPGCEMRLPLEKLKELYGLKDVIVIREEESDSKAMIGWSDKQCVICFRGTASLKAACVDLKAILVAYYARSEWSRASPLARLMAVHHGFQWSWLHNGFSRRVLDWVAQYRAAHPAARILVTGHSLGGAHATLCTLDIVRELGASLPYNQITCYTLGAPRVGNHAFATVYNKVVAETWNVVNGNDVVPMSPKCVFLFVYKHPGHTVIVKRRGDLIVRPTFLENAVARIPGSRSVRHHLTGSYLRSMAAVLRAQTRGKHIEGGVRALLYLSRYDLPEVEAVVAEAAADVQVVTEAALGAVAQTHSSSVREAAKVAAVAAATALPEGDLLFRALAQYGSVRLLAHVHPAVPDVQPSAPSLLLPQHPQLNALPLENKAAFLVRRLKLGLEMLGIEGGLTEEDEAHEENEASSRGRAARAAELAAFEMAKAHRAQAVRRNMPGGLHVLKHAGGGGGAGKQLGRGSVESAVGGRGHVGLVVDAGTRAGSCAVPVSGGGGGTGAVGSPQAQQARGSGDGAMGAAQEEARGSSGGAGPVAEARERSGGLGRASCSSQPAGAARWWRWGAPAQAAAVQQHEYGTPDVAWAQCVALQLRQQAAAAGSGVAGVAPGGGGVPGGAAGLLDRGRAEV